MASPASRREAPVGEVEPERAPGAQAGKSAISRVVVLAISSVVTLATTRMAISFGGPRIFAYIALVGSLISLVPFSDLGTGAAVTNALAEAPGAARDPRVRRVLLTSLRTLSAVGLGVIALAVIFLVVGAWTHILGLSRQNDDRLPVAAAVSFACFGAAMPLGIGQRILLGVGRNHLAVLCQVLSPITSLLLVLTVGLAHADPALMACAPGLAVLVTNWVTTRVAGRVSELPMTELVRSVPLLRSHRGSSIRHLAGPMVLISMALPLAFQSDRLVLAHLSTPSELATYSLSAQMYAPFWSVVSTTGLTLWPMFARARVSGSNVVGALYRAILGLCGIAALGGLALMTLGPWFGGLLSAGDISTPRVVLLGFAAMLMAQALHLPSGMALTDGRGLSFQAISVLSMLALNLGLSLALTPSLGALGPLIASAVSVVTCQFVPCVIYARYRLGLAQIPVEVS